MNKHMNTHTGMHTHMQAVMIQNLQMLNQGIWVLIAMF